MRSAALARRWWALPWWGRWPSLYATLVALCALVGWPTIGLGTSMFLIGAILMLVSLPFIRTGGARRRIVARDLAGRAQREFVPREAREREIQSGIGLFLTGLALWIPLLLRAF